MKSIKESVHHFIMWVDHKIVGKSMVVAHASYYLLVSWEAHGTYRYAAGIILVFTVVEVISHAQPHGPANAVLSAAISEEV